jgi:holo-[acyl-carrier protein] synthase
MTNEDVVITLSKVSRKKPQDIQPHLSLASLGLSSSFGLSAVRSLLEAGGSGKLPPLGMRMTVGQVIDLATGNGPSAEPAPKAAEVLVTSPPTQESSASPGGISINGMGLGMDMQEIASLPLAGDYRSDTFYAGHFHPSEIATAILRPDVRSHLCGIFCAKEAAKKSHPALLNLRMTELLVTHDPAGRPTLQLMDGDAVGASFAFLLSITHTEHYAAATCLTLER